MTAIPEIAVNPKTHAVLAIVEPITSYPVRLNDALWPSCKLCGCKPNYCLCDPEEARLALLGSIYGNGEA